MWSTPWSKLWSIITCNWHDSGLQNNNRHNNQLQKKEKIQKIGPSDLVGYTIQKSKIVLEFCDILNFDLAINYSKLIVAINQEQPTSRKAK